MNSLLLQTWNAIKAVQKPVLAGAIVFGLLYTGVVSYALYAVEQEQSDAAKTLGVSPERIEALLELSESGDTDAAEQMMVELQAASQSFTGMTEEERAVVFQEHSYRLLLELVPIFITAILLLAFVLVLSYVYYITIAVGGSMDMASLVRATVSKVLPCIGLIFWVLIRSHTWILLLSFLPYGYVFTAIGSLCALLFLPFYIVAPVILIKEGCTIREAAQRSYNRSKGHWGKIVGAYVFLCVVAYLLQTLGLILVQSTGAFKIPIVTFVRQLIVAYATFFIVGLNGVLIKKWN
ncbi:MAG: hypothetical protein O2904_04485 [bacterium]|nr:hypothetical protein [bacterium]